MTWVQQLETIITNNKRPTLSPPCHLKPLFADDVDDEEVEEVDAADGVRDGVGVIAAGVGVFFMLPADCVAEAGYK